MKQTNHIEPLADAMIKELRKNCRETGVTFFDVDSGKQGIVHVVGPEQGLTQPGMTIACGDSHTNPRSFWCYCFRYRH